MKKYNLLLFIIFSVPLFSQTKTFVREYTYSAGEADSKITSRAIALDQVKRILLEEIGIYLQSSLEVIKEEKNDVYNELTKQQILSITAGVTETKIIEEKWNGEKYYIKVSISVDPNEVNKNITRIGADQSKVKELEDVRQKADNALAELERLRKELAISKPENERLAKQKEYVVASNILSATDWFRKGYSAYELKNFDNSILCYHQAIELNPQYSEAYVNLGSAYDSKGNFDKAIQFYQKAIEINPQLPEAYLNLGVAYKGKGNFDKAIQSYEKTIELNPQLADAYNNLGIVYKGKGNTDKAIQLYEKAIKLNPQYSNAYNNLGAVYYGKDSLDKAIQLYEKAIKLDPKYSSAYINLGTAYLKNGKKSKAIEAYRKAANLGHSSAQQWLTKNGYTW